MIARVFRYPDRLCAWLAPLTAVALGTVFLSAAEPDSTMPDKASAPAPASIAADDARILYMGRKAFVDSEARMGFPGVTFRFRYRGPAPTVHLTASSATCAFNVSCNGWDPVVVRLNEGANEIPLPSGPAPDSGWAVEFARRNESWQGVATLHSLSLPTGCELLPPPPFPERKLMFIGDSITCGEAIDRFPPELDNTPRMSDAPRSFGMLLGRWLGAQVNLVSYGGRGVMRDWQGITDTNNVPQFFPLALPDDPSIPWDSASYMPDAIVVCLGTNDFNPGLPDEAVYTAAYAAFIGQVRAVHPKAAILLAESPIFGPEPGAPGGGKRGLLRRCLESVVVARRAAGDKRITVAPVRYQPGTKGNGHPSAFQHEQIAEDLIGPIQELTGW